MDKVQIQNLETQYLKAKVAYYDGNPILTDAEFDVIEQELIKIGSKVIDQVGSKRKDFDFPHPSPMKSLSKIQTSTEKGVTDYREVSFMDWFNKRNKQLFNSIKSIHYSPKFDGSAVNIIYRNGNLEAVLTRGDGKFGKDASDRFKSLLPPTINIIGVVEIRCEAVMRKSIFNEKYADEFANARNIVAGIIGKDDIDKEKVSDLTLMPIHLIVDGKHKDITDLKSQIAGYSIFPSTFQIGTIPATKEAYIQIIKYWEDNRDAFAFQLDGVVFSLPIETREFLGENDHDPEWAIAIKFVPEQVVTSVEGVIWNLGKTGELTPVVKLKAVQLAGTTVKRASGYNAGYIVQNKIGEGTIVSIAKAGDIIPEIQKVVVPGVVEELPSTCPSCKQPLTFDGIHLMCNNENCETIIAKKLAAGVGVLDLRSIGGKTIEPFAKSFTDMIQIMKFVLRYHKEPEFSLEKWDIKKGSRSHEIFVSAFTNIKTLNYSQVILMMGLDGVGKKLSEQAAREYCGLVPNYTSMERALVVKLQDPKVKQYVVDTVYDLEHLGVTVDKPMDKIKDNTSIYVCMTGSPKDFGYKTKEEFIKQFPNVVEVDLNNKDCNYLITDSYTSTSSKMKVAEKKGIKIVTYGDFKI